MIAMALRCFCGPTFIRLSPPFARSEEKIGLDFLLLSVKFVIAASGLVERYMGPPFDNASRFHNENLISPPNRGEAVGHDEKRFSFQKIANTFLNERFRF